MVKMSRQLIWLMGIALGVSAFLSQAVYSQEDPALDSTGFDQKVRPQDDLFLAVNGTWLRDTEIPSDKSNYGAFSVLADQAELHIRELIEEAAGTSAARGTDAQKVGDFYKSFMDVERVNELSFSPLKTELATIDGLKSREDVVLYFGHLQRIGVTTPMGLFVTIDAKDSTRYLAALVQSGTTLPDRDYYLKDDEESVAAREALSQYIEQVLELIQSDDSSRADEIIALEKRLAEAQWSRVELRDAEKRYNLFTVSGLTELAGNVPWKAFLEKADVGMIEEVNVMTPGYFEKLDAILAETPVETWQGYLRFHLIDDFAPILSEDFVDAHFELHERVLAGIPEQKPRWKEAVALVAGGGAGDFGALGDLVGRLYVEKHFPPEHKAQMDALVNNLLRAFGESIDELEWMTDETKVRAREKLDKIVTKIGYPEKWRDYSGLTVVPDNLFANVVNSRSVEYQRMIDKLGKPIDRTEWGMTPQTVNAYYNPTMNEIVFPAAILQPPFFNVDADDAVNYGGIGAVIGHEISHAFDDQGSKYDGDGNLNNWWTDADREAFTELTTRLIDQYAEYEPLPGKRVNGQLTLGENIADLSGLAIAFKAYGISREGKPAAEVAGWSGEQRFFLGWSQVWRRKYRDAEMVKRLLIDSHSPSWYRANGPVTNIDAFYSAFDVQPGDALFKPVDERIRIW